MEDRYVENNSLDMKKRRRTRYWNCGEELGQRRSMKMVKNMQKGSGDDAFLCERID